MLVRLVRQLLSRLRTLLPREGYKNNEMRGIRQGTDCLRNPNDPLFLRIAQLLTEKGIDPNTAILAELFPDDPCFQVGVVVTPDKRAYEFGFDWLHKPISEGVFSEWKDITGKSAYWDRVKLALEYLDEQGGK